MGQVLHGSATTTEAIRRAIQHSKREPESALQTLRHQSKDGAQVEGAQLGRGPTDGTKGTAIDGAVDQGRGGHRWLPPAYASAARRLLVRTPADNPASDALVIASLSATAWVSDTVMIRMPRMRRRKRLATDWSGALVLPWNL